MGDRIITAVAGIAAGIAIVVLLVALGLAQHEIREVEAQAEVACLIKNQYHDDIVSSENLLFFLRDQVEVNCGEVLTIDIAPNGDARVIWRDPIGD